MTKFVRATHYAKAVRSRCLMPNAYAYAYAYTINLGKASDL